MTSGGAERDWEMVIGLEVHSELATTTKMFCGCLNAFGDEPNTNVCPVCLGLPGSLPVLNEQAVELAMRIGVALHCDVRPSEFARKNYFYPDQAKDYQISQYDLPLNLGGWLELPDGSRVGVTRAHMEEDTGKLTHVGASGRINAAEHALVDYNRSGVPLVEIVSEPDIRSAAQARAYAAEIRGHPHGDGRIGRPDGGGLHAGGCQRVGPALGFHVIRHPLRGEEPQLSALARTGDRLRGRPADRGPRVRGQRRPGDPPLGRVGGAHRSAALQGGGQRLPVLPRARPGAAGARRRVARGCGHRSGRCRPTAGPDWPRPSARTRARRKPTRSAPWSTSDWTGSSRRRPRPEHHPPWPWLVPPTRWRPRLTRPRDLDASSFVSLLAMESGGQLSATQSKAVLSALLERGGGDPAALAKEMGFEALGSDSLGAVLDEVIVAHAEEWARFVEGDDKLMGFFTGAVMKATSGKANGKEVAAELRRRRG